MSELVPVKQFDVAVISNMGEIYREEMDGLTFTPDRVKIPSGGGLTFEIPSDDQDNPEIAKELIGVIVDHYPVNAYWTNKYSGANTPPDCYSMDGKHGTGMPGGDCVRCAYNQWGSDSDGRGKACKNMRRIYILREGASLPLLLTLPPTSIRNFGDYIAKRVMAKGRPSYGVITKITLKRVNNASGIAYSQAVFSLAGLLDAETMQRMAEYSAGIKAVTRKQEIAHDEYADDSNGNGLASTGADVPY